MRWDELFHDLESQWEAEARRELDGEVADRTRRERAGIGLGERLAAEDGATLAVGVSSGGRLEGQVADVGRGWLLLDTAVGAALVPFSAVTFVVGAGSRANDLRPGRAFGFGYALRALSRDRAVVSVTDVSGRVATGTIDAAGRDLFELSEHPADLPRRPENLTARRLVPFAAVAVVHQASR